MSDQGIISPDSVPPGTLGSVLPMEDFRISMEGILKLLKSLKPGKAAGPDKLKNRKENPQKLTQLSSRSHPRHLVGKKTLLLQELRNEIAPILQIIFERFLQTAKLSSDWSKALVAPIFKNGVMSSAANYRPISLTCILCKVLVHIIASNVVEHMNKHDLLYDLQHGFREKKGHVKHSSP